MGINRKIRERAARGTPARAAAKRTLGGALWGPPLVALAGVALAAVVLSGACGGGGGGAADVTGGGADAQSDGGRSYLLAGRAERYDLTNARRWAISVAGLTQPAVAGEADAGGAADADAGPGAWDDTLDGGAQGAGQPEEPVVEAVVVPLYRLGVPWEAFAQGGGANLPGPWVLAVQEAQTEAESLGLPVALSLSPANETWDHLAPLATDDGTGTLRLEDNWLHDYCYDPSADPQPDKWRDAYVRYAEWATKRFSPRWVFLAHRVNLYDARCAATRPNAYAAVAAFATAAHQRIHEALDPAPITVVTVDVEDLYGYPSQPGRCVGTEGAECLGERGALLQTLEADRLGLESYPEAALPRLGEIPPGWLEGVMAARPDLPPLVAGTGLPAVRMERRKSQVCIPLLESSAELQRGWLDQVLAAAAAHEMDLVVWTYPESLLDESLVAPCDCPGGDAEADAVCAHLAQLGARADELRPRLIEGLWRGRQGLASGGAERPAAAIWRGVLAEPGPVSN